MKKVIVVGANGFLGRELCKKLASKGIAVVALVAKGGDYSFAKSLHNVNCIEFDLSWIVDWDGIEEIKGADTMFYMAWAGVSSTYKNQVEIQVSNILYGIQVMVVA